MKTVSILLSVFNKEKFILDTIKSIDSQVTRDKFSIELCIIDDCSTDASMQIINDYQWRNPISLKIIRTEINSGPATAMNIALENSTGVYIVPHDADDLITRLGILKRFEALEANAQFDWVTGNELIIDINGRVVAGSEFVKIQSWSNQEELQDLVFGGMLIPAQSIMIRRKAAFEVGWDKELFSTQDTWINYILTVKGYKLLKIDDYVACYRAPAGADDTNSTHIATMKSGKKYKDFLVIRSRIYSYLTTKQIEWFDGEIEKARKRAEQI